MILPILTLLLIAIILFAVCRYWLWGPRTSSWLRSNNEEKIGLSKNKLYNANGCIVQSGSEILLGSTGSFKRFESVDRSTYEGELVAPMPTPPWSTDETIPPQPLRPAPLPIAAKFKSRSSTSSYSSTSSSLMSKQDSLEPKSITSAPALKSIPRPIPRKQNSAPAGSCQIPLINPPSEQQQRGLHKIVKDVQATTNPFLNGLINLEAIKTNFFSTTVVQDTPECKIENERAVRSAIISKNPFKTSSSSSVSLSSCDNTFFDFNPNTIKSIMEEEPPDDGYEGDNDDCDDPLKQLEARIQKLEASNKQRRRSGSQSPPLRFSPKVLNKQPPASPLENNLDLISNVNEKFIDSPFNDENVTRNFRKHIRNRSYSENEAGELGILCEQSNFKEQLSPPPPISVTSVTTIATNPFNCTNSKRPLLKTPSETYLEQYSTMMKSSGGPTVIVNNNKPVQLCKHPSLTKILQSSSSSLFDSTTETAQNLSALKRTVSSESISSDSSVIMSTLERSAPPITGNLCIALQYDKHSITEDGCELMVSIVEARDLVIPADADPDIVDTFVRVYLLPDQTEPVQTKIFRNSNNPSYQESFLFFITKQNIKRSLWFHLYHTNAHCTTLIGETELKLTEFARPRTTWVQLSDSRNNCTNCGDLMFSLSYLPTAERLTVVVVKARNLKAIRDENENHAISENEIQNVYVKVYLLKNDKKVSKKRTSTKRGERNPLFNEAMIFSVPPYMLNSIQVRLTVMNSPPGIQDTQDAARKSYPIGHVIVGSRTDGKGLLHWHQMLTTLRKQVAFFHPLRRSINKQQSSSSTASSLPSSLEYKDRSFYSNFVNSKSLTYFFPY
ncbi:hypothetical protein PVAND_013369 [Polypedilum vanderplanki]|uniref:C2 domain-containing protein n=1 Tax=Polypedilum vanderplanki TaxID=319348 RepID=A0A9J6CQ46_POLVA|nr:hypothetical protein PVAND_013369 [Polypedilum vanderplanki]